MPSRQTGSNLTIGDLSIRLRILPILLPYLKEICSPLFLELAAFVDRLRLHLTALVQLPQPTVSHETSPVQVSLFGSKLLRGQLAKHLRTCELVLRRLAESGDSTQEPGSTPFAIFKRR